MNRTDSIRGYISHRTLIILAAGSVISAGLSVYFMGSARDVPWLSFGVAAILLGCSVLLPMPQSSREKRRAFLAVIGLIVGALAVGSFLSQDFFRR